MKQGLVESVREATFRNEAECVADLARMLDLPAWEREAISSKATELVNDIRAVAVHADGRVVVGTAAGLAIGTPDGAGGLAFVRHGFAGGLPGRGVYDVLVAVDGTIWVRSDDGVAQLVP